MLEVLWESPEDAWLTVRDVHGTLAANREVAYTTVMTVMDRLSRKNHVIQRKDGRAYLYRARASRATMVADLLANTLNEFSGVERQAALMAFVDDASGADVAALRRALERLEEA